MTDWPDWRADLFDPKKVPFSRRESFLAISWIAADSAFFLRNLRGGDEHTNLGRLLRLTVLDKTGAPVAADWHLQPDCLSAHHGTQSLRFRFIGPDRISVQSDGLGLRLQSGASKYNYAQAGDPIHICIADQDLRCDVSVAVGAADLNAPWNGLSSDGINLDILPSADAVRAEINAYRVIPVQNGTLQADPETASAADFAAFLRSMPQVPPEFSSARLLASYVLWSNYVPAEGALSLPAVYVSKNWMTNIWSWDHCFVALAFAKAHPDLAFQQMAVIFNAQSESGRLPDFINDRYAYWAFTKPPVHGWAFAKLRQAAPGFYTRDRMEQVLQWLARQVASWLGGPNWRGLPAYRHGNDAGWDNATPFAEGGPLASPDLATFLIVQLDEIAELHLALGQPAEAAAAKDQADRLCATLFQELWTGTGFAARLCRDGQSVTTGNSLLALMPLLLGDRLSPDMRTTLLGNLLAPGRFLTEFGLATEATDSPLYTPNGYWRGPVWAPTTALFVDALHRCHQSATAAEISRRYLALCDRGGMAENHDALTGAGLCDPALSWTAAVFLTLGDCPSA